MSLLVCLALLAVPQDPITGEVGKIYWPPRHATPLSYEARLVKRRSLSAETERAVRVCPQPGVRDRVEPWAPDENGRYQRMLRAYQVMPDAELLQVQEVRLRRPVAEIVSRPHVRVTCATCGEEVINEREVERDGQVLCRVCAGDAYYLA